MWNIHQSQSTSMPSHKNTCRVTTSLLLTPVCPTLLEEFEKPWLRKWEKKRLLEETTVMAPISHQKSLDSAGEEKHL